MASRLSSNGSMSFAFAGRWTGTGSCSTQPPVGWTSGATSKCDSDAHGTRVDDPEVPAMARRGSASGGNLMVHMESVAEEAVVVVKAEEKHERTVATPLDASVHCLPELLEEPGNFQEARSSY